MTEEASVRRVLTSSDELDALGAYSVVQVDGRDVWLSHPTRYGTRWVALEVDTSDPTDIDVDMERNEWYLFTAFHPSRGPRTVTLLRDGNE